MVLPRRDRVNFESCQSWRETPYHQVRITSALKSFYLDKHMGKQGHSNKARQVHVNIFRQLSVPLMWKCSFNLSILPVFCPSALENNQYLRRKCTVIVYEVSLFFQMHNSGTESRIWCLPSWHPSGACEGYSNCFSTRRAEGKSECSASHGRGCFPGLPKSSPPNIPLPPFLSLASSLDLEGGAYVWFGELITSEKISCVNS